MLSLRELLREGPEARLREVMRTDPIFVRVDTDQEVVAQEVARYNLVAIPVVDEESRLVGIISVDQVIDIIEEEATEDLLKLAGTALDIPSISK